MAIKLGTTHTSADFAASGVSHRPAINKIQRQMAALSGHGPAQPNQTIAARIVHVAASQILVGTAGDDTLVGGDGKDKLIGGLGADQLTGGAGDDIFKYYALAEIGGIRKHDIITDLAVGDKISLSSIGKLAFVGVGNNFSGSAYQVRAYAGGPDTTLLQIDTDGDKIANYSLTLSGRMTIEETVAGSLIFQVAANQALDGTVANDTLTGGPGDDVINGGKGDDTLIGDNADDTLTGGLGIDQLTGGLGNDTFKYNTLAELVGDTITDLAVGDKIDLSAIDANALQTGDQAFSFIGGNAFTGTAGQLHYVFGYVSGDVNGDALDDFYISLPSANHIPTASDFIL